MAIGINVSDIQPNSIEIDELTQSLTLQLRYYKAKIVADDQDKLLELIEGLKKLIRVEEPEPKESGELPEFYKEEK